MKEYTESGKRNAFLQVFKAGIGAVIGAGVVPGLAKAAGEYAQEMAEGDKFEWLPVEGPGIDQFFKDVENPANGWESRPLTVIDGSLDNTNSRVDPEHFTQGVYDRNILMEMGADTSTNEFIFKVKGACKDTIKSLSLNQRGTGYTALNEKGQTVKISMNPEAVLSAWQRFGGLGKISMLARGVVTTETKAPGYQHPEFLDMTEANRLGVNPIFAAAFSYDKGPIPDRGITTFDISTNSGLTPPFYMIKLDKYDGSTAYLKAKSMNTGNGTGIT